MKGRKVIVSTCGTSIFTNGADDKMRKLLNSSSNKKKTDIPSEDRKQIDDWIAKRASKLRVANEVDAADMSAELNGLLTYYRAAGVDIKDAGQDQHYLVSTDTYLGERASNCISDWWKRRGGGRLTNITTGGLNTSDMDDFRAALADIVDILDGNGLANWRREGRHVAFNLTGGFKSVNGFMQSLGMLFADECFYFFEGSQEIMRVPLLPLKLDARSAFEHDLFSVRQMANEIEVDSRDCSGIPETLLFKVSGRATLSEWGRTLWIAERKEIYGERLMEPLSRKVRFSQKFTDQVEDRKRLLSHKSRVSGLNVRLDNLARCIDEGGQHGKYNPRALRFKRIKGPSIKGSDHEFYIWSDLNRRGYGHFDKGVFEVDRIDDHL